MWPLPPISNKAVHIILHPEKLICYYIAWQKDMLQVSQQQFDLNIDEIILYNPTGLVQAIYTFIKQYKLSHAYSYFVICKPLMTERIIDHINSHAQLEDLIEPTYHMHHQHQYLGPHQKKYSFYICSISKALLFQLKIIHNRLPLYLQAIRPALSVQYDVYEQLQRKPISQAQLVDAIDHQTLEIKELLATQPLYNKINTKITYDKNLMYALGSFIGSHT